MKKTEKLIFIGIITILAIIIIYALGGVLNWYLNGKSNDDIMNEINEAVKTTTHSDDEIIYDEKDEIENSKASSIYNTYANMQDIDFDKLLDINKDTVAWLKVGGTKVNYPVVQSDDNEFYLKHDYNKKKNSHGWVFADYRNDFTNLTYNNIIYGHNLKNKTMFGTLNDVTKKSWYSKKGNQIITLTTKDYIYQFQIYSIYIIPKESYYITTYFENKQVYKEWLDITKSRSINNFNVDVNEKDVVLTLSTCSKKVNRIAIHSKLIKTIKKN